MKQKQPKKDILLQAGFWVLLGTLCIAASAPETPDKPGLEQVRNQLRQSVETIDQGEVLKQEWARQKELYKGKFEALLKQLHDRSLEMDSALDFGDPELRADIHETGADLTRVKKDLEQISAEVSVTAAVRVMNIKNDISDAVSDIRD
jgi:hypothetical protein